MLIQGGVDGILVDEARFADREYAAHADDLDVIPTMFRGYEWPSDLSDWRQLSALLLGDVVGKDVLDFGCGLGEESIYFAKLGARVTGVDISEIGIASLRKRAAFHGLEVRALRMRVDPTSLPAGSFDRVHGLGILHHVGIEAGLAEVRRLLRPGGLGVFLEPLGDSPTIEAVKAWLMRHGRFLGHFDDVTEHERNLTWREVVRATRGFSAAAVFPYHLLYRLKRFAPAKVLPAIRRVDHGLLAIAPWLRHYAGCVVIRVRK